jgi:zinc/manganese transport system substrate-binding protein
MKKSLLIVAGILALCSATPALAKDLNVVASFTVLADMVHEVGGSHVTVRSLVGANGDPHVYEPTPADSAALAHADLVFVSGLGLEGWMERLITASGYKGKIVVASDGIGTRTMIDTDDDAGAAPTSGGEPAGKLITDPHAWNSVANAVIYATNIEKAFEAVDPADADRFKANGDRYIGALKGLDAWVHQQINEVPAAKRKVITTHDAFGYFGAAYGVDFRAPIGFSTEAEASARQVAALIDQIRKEGIKAVFLENANDPRLIEQIARETGARLGGTLYPEALSAADGPATSYVKMIRYNVSLLKAGMLTN